MTEDRRSYQREVERLLEQIRERVHELQLLKVRGARGPVLQEQKQELARTRKELAAVVAASSDSDRPARRPGSWSRRPGRGQLPVRVTAASRSIGTSN
jgi:hypothetical protein